MSKVKTTSSDGATAGTSGTTSTSSAPLSTGAGQPVPATGSSASRPVNDAHVDAVCT